MTTISPADAAARATGPDAAIVLDVRSPAEHAGVHVTGSVNAPVDLVRADPARMAAATDRDVLVLCGTGVRATAAARALEPHLGPRVQVIDGGMRAWQAAGLPVEPGTQGPWAMERQVRATAGSIVLAGVLASTVAPRAKWLSAGIGAGLLYSGVSDTCGMAAVLARMPWNRGVAEPGIDDVVTALGAR